VSRPRSKSGFSAYALEFPTHGADRVSNELRLKGINVSAPTGVRGVWSRHNLETRTKRLLRLEREVKDNAFMLSED